MFAAVDKIKLFTWLRHWHHSKSSATSNADGSTQGENIVSRPAIKYRSKGWMSYWNPLHLEKRSCAHTRDVYTEDYHQQQHAPRFQLTSASNHPAQSKGAEDAAHHHNHHTTYKGSKSSSVDLDHQNMDVPTMASILSDKHQHQPFVDLKAAVVKLDQPARKQHGVDLDAVSLEFQPQHKLGLKNRVLPLVVQENSEYLSGCPQLHSQEGVLPMPKGAGPISLKRLTFAKVSSSPESPRSPRDIKWRKLLSYSRSGSPRSSSCFHEWNNNHHHIERAVSGPTGSLSTMGSPWNSRAGSYRPHANRRSSFKGVYDQGQWITTDSEFVVLEL